MRPQTNSKRSVVTLDGVWGFLQDPEKKGEKEKWFNGLPESSPIAVPGSWNTQGVGVDQQEYIGLAWYFKKQIIPETAKNYRIFFYVGGCNHKAKFWVNGKEIGYSDQAFLPSNYEITDIVEVGQENTFAVSISNENSSKDILKGHSDEKRLPKLSEGQLPWVNFDWYPFGGIHRSVYLSFVPRNYISDVCFTTKEILSGKAEVSVGIDIESQVSDGTLKISLLDEDRCVVDKVIDSQCNALSFVVDNPKLWSCESPSLYRLKVELQDNAGNILDEYLIKVGIRTIEIEGQKIFLNGKPVFLRGLSKHEDFPVIGKGTMDALIVKDYSLMKWIGANSYRTTHYPYDEKWLDYADEQGILIIDEVCANGLDFGLPSSDIDEVLAKHKEYCSGLISRDKNHPSVVMWSLANEPQSHQEGSEDYFAAVIEHVREVDPTRLVTVVTNKGKWFAPDGTGKEFVNKLVDVICVNRYFGWYDNYGMLDFAMGELSKDLDEFEAFDKPVILSEFGGECIAGLHETSDKQFSEEYQTKLLLKTIEIAESKSFIVGTQVWCFADFDTPQALQRVFGNNKGVFTRTRNPKMSAWFIREHWTGKGLL